MVQLFDLRHQREILIHFSDSRGPESFPGIRWRAVWARDWTSSHPISDTLLYLLSHSWDGDFYLQPLSLSNVGIVPGRTLKSSRKQAAVQSSLAPGWRQTRWNWSQTEGSKAALIWPVSWNDKAKTHSNVSPGENIFQSVFVHAHANNEMWLQITFHFTFGGGTIKTVRGKIAHALQLAYEMLFITGKKAHKAVCVCLKQLPVCWLLWASLLKLKRIGHPCIALEPTEEVKRSHRKIRENSFAAPVVPTGQICILLSMSPVCRR